MLTAGKPELETKTIDKLLYIRRVLLYIEKHLSDEIKPENIAERHYVSQSRLYRDFYACTGHSVKEYIRKRRISNACEKIRCSSLSLAVIADESGCQTQQAFNKLFKSIVGMTPLEYREGETYFYFYPSIQDDDFSCNKIGFAVQVGTETIPECKITRFYDSCLVGIEDKAIAAFYGFSGRVFGRNGKQLGSRFCYEVMTETAGAGSTDLYASCVVNYTEPEINAGWNYLYNTWLSSSMFEESGDGYFEEYIFQDNRPLKPRKLKLYLPVKKRKTERHIAVTAVPKTVFVTAREFGRDAERVASEKVIYYLQEHHPLLIRNARRFYVCAYEDICECGVECGEGFKLPDGSGLEILRVPAGRYAVLPDNRLGDINAGNAKLNLWLTNNAVPHEDMPAFAVYEITNGKYDNENIRMKLYKCLKIDKNG